MLVKEWTPEEYAGRDADAASHWLTARLEAARALVQIESGMACGKLGFSTAFDYLTGNEKKDCQMPGCWRCRAPCSTRYCGI